MKVLVGAAVCFCLFFLTHMLIWRLFRPASPTRLAAYCALFVLPATYFVLVVLWAPFSLAEAIEWTALSVAVVAVYLTLMPVIESDSPSFLITMLVNAREPEGVTSEEIAKVVTDERFILNRLQSLETEKLVRLRNGEYQITPAGRAFLKFYTVFHELAGRAGRGG